MVNRDKPTRHGTSHGDAHEKPPAPDWILANIAEASKNAQQVFFILVSLLVYCAISVTGTADRQVVLNSTVQLPILNSTVSLEAFFLLAPIFGLLVFVYLQLYLQRLKGLIQQLKQEYSAVEPRRLYPWVLTIAEDPEPGSIGILQGVMVDVSLWWLLPFVLLLFAVWSVRKHSLWLSYSVGSYSVVALLVVLFFWVKYERRNGIHSFRRGMWVLAAVIVFSDLAIMFYLIPVANFGQLKFPAHGQVGAQGLHSRWQGIVRSWTCVNLSYQVLITEQKNEYDTYWVNLEGAHLEGANLDHTILKLANLRDAHLQGSNLFDATLRTAMLEGADFKYAAMDGADFSYARLMGAKNVDPRELCKARTVYKAKLDVDLEQKLKASCPSVLTEESQNW
jgi:hypothetical protein